MTEQEVERVAFEDLLTEIAPYANHMRDAEGVYVDAFARGAYVIFKHLSAVPNKHEAYEQGQLDIAGQCLEERDALLAKVDKHEKALAVARDFINQIAPWDFRPSMRIELEHQAMIMGWPKNARETLATVDEIVGE